MEYKDYPEDKDDLDYEEEYSEDDFLDDNQDDFEAEREKKTLTPERTLKIILGIVIAAFIILFVLMCISFVVRSRNKRNETTTISNESTTIAANAVEKPENKYPTGEYKVNIGENETLNLREDHSKDAEVVKTALNGTVLTINEIYFDETAEPERQYWGKTVYSGYEVWVSLNYLVKLNGENNATLFETTKEPEKTTAAEKTTDEEKTAAEEKTTAVEGTTLNSSSAIGPNKPGKYTVDADDFLRLRDGHSVDNVSQLNIPKGETLIITEVYHDENAKDKHMIYWGKTTYAGQTGWVAMGYLK